MNGNSIELQATVTHSSEISPPPYMVGAAEIEVDTETGEVTLLDYAAAVDCGTPINPNLTRVQAEGGIAQGIGMTLTESVTYDDRGYPTWKIRFSSTRFPHAWTSARSAWSSRTATRAKARSVRNPSARLLSIHRCRRFRMQSEMP